MLTTPNTTPDSSRTTKLNEWKSLGKVNRHCKTYSFIFNIIFYFYFKRKKLNVFQFSGRYFSIKCVCLKSCQIHRDTYGSVCLCKHQDIVKSFDILFMESETYINYSTLNRCWNKTSSLPVAFWNHKVDNKQWTVGCPILYNVHTSSNLCGSDICHYICYKNYGT